MKEMTPVKAVFASELPVSGRMSPARSRNLRRAVAASFSLHMAATCAASLTSIVAVERVPAPPVVIRFVPSLSPVLHAFRQPLEPETPEERVTPAPPPPVARPTPPPPAPPPPRPAVAENALTEPAPEIPKTSEVPVEAIPKDTFEPPVPVTATGRSGGRGVALIPGYVDTFAPAGGARAGGVSDPDPPVPGTVRAGAGGLPAGTPAGSPALPVDSVRPEGASTVGRSRGGRTGAGTSADGPEPGPGDGGSEGETAVLLGRRYNLDLIDASRLGRSTHDGWRYNLLVPMLSELYHRVEEAGRPAKPGEAAGDGVLSVRVDPDAVIIAYSDGTKHVIAPTKDGLVALYVTRGAVGRGKVDEAQRALGALRRLTHDGVRS